MYIDIDICLERMEKRTAEFLETWGQQRGTVATMPHGKQLIAAAKALLTAARKLREEDGLGR